MTSANGQVFGISVGYGMIVGVGFAFAIIMVGITKILSKYMNEMQDSEMLMTAKRSIKSGLVASAVVSSWTIGSTLLLSCTSAYSNGVSSAYWYGAGACVQIIIFSTMALEMKKKAPSCHTYQEIVRTRYGPATHIVSIIYSIIQMVCYTTNLLINGSSVFEAITGVNRDASIVLFPIGVIIYTLLGGIKATFLTDWTHTVIIYAILLTFMFNCYATNPIVGSPGALWEMLVETSARRPIAGNMDGSLLTFNSVQGGLFGLVLFGAGWAAAVDSQLFQKAIAADHKTLISGYVLGGLCWFALPFCLSTTMGLLAAGLETHPSFPTYPELMTADQISAGLVLPFAAEALMGKSGVAMVLTMVFMAVTAAFSSETIALSAMMTHDVYKAYFDPKAKGKKLILVSHSCVIVFGIVTVALGIGLSHAGFDVSFITTASGIIVNVNVGAIIFTLFWKKVSGFAYMAGTILSTLISVAVWMGYTVSQSGYVSLSTLSTNEALAAGNTMAIGVPFLLIPLFTLIKPADFDWDIWLDIKQDDNSDFNKEHGLTNILSQDEATKAILDERNRLDKELNRQSKIGFGLTILFVLFFLILFPLPLYGSKYVFSKSFFRGWIVVMFLWGFFAAITIILLPLWDGRQSLKRLFDIVVLKKTEEKPLGDIYFVKSLEGQTIEESPDESSSVGKEKISQKVDQV
ncbi:hypothetical protein PSN45_004112 [Yamadazyma tenuis]|uniref:Urea active transporter n=1 Tax=Candida tenuis (strain ATCC 10573 / BCRC 21748 / CBS 615 / JCM 9827 / NBRC 10315 / NRRL Y-1498 / VKM Y-70) TaxID=590646 RepID=G3B4G1_CANTC|nr:uncharacterized protein CANTEDRAFT_121525 [Yamadazyma tenuis ATCC 10573]EGV63817.1 hypothetical protein CANTEDRAFT_121525 [Yamadazyma tenuis ATCC 10573]WEJ96573.1 hypothetical protein PSN45_004112 [Yamadazyma tenuis]